MPQYPVETEVIFCVWGVVSPLLANVYLHYVFDLWVEAWRKKAATGDVIVVRYADDVVLGFQYRTDAERFLRDFRERLVKFGLELHPDKTRLIEFGRFALRPKTAWRGKTRDLRIFGIHPLLWASQE
jgi:RNA-directed DNA polymerase